MAARRVIILVAVCLLLTLTCFAVFYVNVKSNAPATLRRAAVLLDTMQPERARGVLFTLKLFRICRSDTLYLFGLSYLIEGNTAEAVRWLSHVPDDSECSDSARISLASALIGEFSFEDAEGVLRRHLQLTPDSSTAVRMLSGIMLTELRQEQAVLLLEGFLQRDGASLQDPEVLKLLLQDLSHAEFHPPRGETVESTLEDANSRQPGQLSVVLPLAQIYWQTGRVDQASAVLTATLETHGTDLRCRIAVCEFMLEQDEFQKADQILGDFSGDSADGSVSPDWQREFWFLKCRVAEGQKLYEAALGYLSKAESIRALNTKEQTHRARVLRRSGNEAEAQAAYKRANQSAEIDLKLWSLSRDIGRRMPSTRECLEMARLYEMARRPVAATWWRRLSEFLGMPNKEGGPDLRSGHAILLPVPQLKRRSTSTRS